MIIPFAIYQTMSVVGSGQKMSWSVLEVILRYIILSSAKRTYWKFYVFVFVICVEQEDGRS